MKIKLDENLLLQIGIELRARTHDVYTVGEESLSGRADLDIWQAAQREGRVLITQDLDFSDTRKFVPGGAPRHRAGKPVLAQPTKFNRSCHRAL